MMLTQKFPITPSLPWAWWAVVSIGQKEIISILGEGLLRPFIQAFDNA